MKNNGLQNRFPDKVEQFWRTGSYGYECFNDKCGHQNHANATHHIISPVAFCYVDGKHNESIFNSCRLNNENCHIGKPLQNKELQKRYLQRTFEIVIEAVINREYELDDDDYTFLRVYKKMYDLSTIKQFDFQRVGMVKLNQWIETLQ